MHDDNIYENPLLKYFDDMDILYNNIFDVLYNDIIELKKNNNYSRSKVFLHLVEYWKIYEHFRPHSITQHSPYWGTVNRIEAIYFTLLKYLDCDALVITFSKNASEIFYSYTNTKKQEHCNIAWDEILNDISDISNAIIRTIELNAIEIYYVIGNNSSYIIKAMVKRFITDLFIIDESSIELIENEIQINDKKIFAKNGYILIENLLRLKYESKK